MTFRARLLLGFGAVVLVPLTVFGWRIRAVMTNRVTAEYQQRVAALVSVIRADLDRQSAGIALRLGALRDAIIQDNARAYAGAREGFDPREEPPDLSRVLIEQGKAQEALPYVEGVVTADSTSNEAYRLLGRVKRELGDSTGAIEAFKKAIVLDQRDAWSMNNLAKVYIGQGRYEDALGPLARAIEIDSTIVAFHRNLGGRALERTADRSRLAEAFVEQVKTWR
jgi:tetratricopeptide (TPR) repeat protein